ASTKHDAGRSRACESFEAGATGDHVHQAAAQTFPDAGEIIAAQFEATPHSNGRGVIGHRYGLSVERSGLLLRLLGLLVILHLLVVHLLRACLQTCIGVVESSVGLPAD